MYYSRLIFYYQINNPFIKRQEFKKTNFDYDFNYHTCISSCDHMYLQWILYFHTLNDRIKIVLMNRYTISNPSKEDYPQLVAVWESSVKQHIIF